MITQPVIDIVPETFVIDYKSFGVPGFTPTAYIAPPNITYQDWLKAGEVIRRIDRLKNFAMGDWIAIGEQKFGEMYAQAMDDFEWGSYSKLSKLVWVARSIPPGNRRVELTWTHHHHVAKLKPEEQSYWLQVAIDEKLTSDDLRECIADYLGRPTLPTPPPPPPPAEPEDLTYRSTNHRELATIQAAMDTVQRQRWPTTVGATGLPPVMRPHEHEALSTYANVTADMSKWMIGDHGLQVEREIDHLARLYKWAPEKRQANLSTKLSDAAAQHRMALPEFEQHMETARMFGADMRRQSATVGYEHHFILRNRSRAEAVEYLDRAEREGWTVQRLEAELHPQQPDVETATQIISNMQTASIVGNTITINGLHSTLVITQWRIE